MHNKIFLWLILMVSFIDINAQVTLPKGLPSPYSTNWYRVGWIQGDSGSIASLRDTTLRPTFPGTSVFWQHAGVDSVGWVWDGFHWKRGGGVSTFNGRSGNVVLNSSDVTTALGYTPLSNITNYLQAGINVTVTGLGTLASPYVINSSGGGGGGTVSSFSFTNGNGLTGIVTNSTTTPTLSMGTSLNGIISGNGTAFTTVGIGSGLSYIGGTLSATGGTSLNGLVSANGSAFITTTIGAGLSYVGSTLTNTINNTNQLTNGAGFLTNITGLATQGTNITITGSGTSGSPYVINASGGGTGTVTTFSSGNLSPLFTTSVTNPNTIPALAFTLSNAAANSVFGNNTGSSAPPVFYVPTSTTLNGWFGGTIQPAISFTTTGSGAPTFISNTLNIPANTLTYSQNAINNTLGINSANTVTFLIADHTHAGLLDSARATYVDSLKNGFKIFNLYAINGLQPLGSSSLVDSIGLGGTLYQNTTISGSNAFAFILDSMHAATGHGFKVNFGSDAPWDLVTRDSITGFWTRVPKGSPGQFFHMSLSGGYDWAVPGGGGTVSSVGLSLPTSLFAVSGSPVNTSGTLTGAFNTFNAGQVLISDSVNNGQVPTMRNLVVRDIPSFANWPAPRQFGTIYQMDSIVNLNNFSVVGGVTVALNNGSIDFSVTNNANYANRLIILPNRPTHLNYWKLSVDAKIKAWTAGSSWFGLVMKSLVNHNGANFGYAFLINSSNSGAGTERIYDEGITSLLASGTGNTIHLGDSIRYTFSFTDSVLTATSQNITTGQATPTVITYTFPSNMSSIVPNLGNWALFGSGTGGTITASNINISSTDTINSNLHIIGDSKVKVGYASSFAGTISEQLENSGLYSPVTMSAGSAENLTDILQSNNELAQFRPSQVLLVAPGENDLRAGVSLPVVEQNFMKLYTMYAGGGAKVCVCALPEDSAAGGISLYAFDQYLRTFPCYIHSWDSLAIGDSLNIIYSHGDGAHLNQAGINKFVQAVEASGAFGSIGTSRRSPFRVADNFVQWEGDSIYLNFPHESNIGYMLKSYASPKFPNQQPGYAPSSFLYEDVTHTYVSATSGVTPVTGVLFNVNGSIASVGTVAALYTQDRSNSANSWQVYVNSNQTRININGIDEDYFDPSGKILAGHQTGSPTILGALDIANSFTNAAAMGTRGLELNVDSGVTVTMPANATAWYNTASIFGTKATAASGGATNSATLYIDGLNVAAGGYTFTNPASALYVNAGKSWFGDTVQLNKTPLGTSAMAVLVLNQLTKTIDTVAQSTLGGGVTTVGTFSGSSHVNGASISGSTITFSPADGTNPGMVTTGTQTFAGDKLMTATLDIGGSAAAPGPKFTLDGNVSQTDGIPTRGFWLNITRGNTYTEQAPTGTFATGAVAYIGDQTFTATNTITYTNAATLQINNAPTAGSNVTITNPWSLYVAAGNSFFNGNTTIAANSSLIAGHVVGNSGSPGIAAGMGAGTGPTVALTGTDQDGLITVTTGTTPSLSATVVTVTYNFAYPTNTFPVLTPANSNAALLSGVTMVFTAGSTTTFIITSGTTALTSATQYKWFYHVGAN